MVQIQSIEASTGLQTSGLEPVEAPLFELYDARFDPFSELGEVEIWVPVVPAAR